MKKIYLSLFAVVLLGSQFSFSQKVAPAYNNNVNSVLRQPTQVTPLIPTVENVPGSHGFINDRCGYTTQFNKAVAAGYNLNAFESVINSKIEEIKAARAAGRFANYVIPVVFHIIHDGTAEGTGANLSASQVNEQINQLNLDYANLSGSPYAQAANSGITFCAVTVDPNGNVLAQPGINRINRISAGWTDPTTFGSSNAQVNAMINYINNTIKPASIWDPTRFVNIWSYNFSNSGLLGYATFPTAGLPDLPAGGETATTAGCVFLSGSLGSVASPGTATPYALGRTVGHEIGHFLGLYHTWGNANSGCGVTDYCGDTPECSGPFFSEVPACATTTQCGNTRMIENYMDYSDDGCMNTFTQNQVDRMQAVMLASPRRPANTTLCAPPVPDLLQFTSTSTAVSETGTGTTCPTRFRDYLVSVKPAGAADGAATVNFTFAGSATQNIDYSIVGASSVSFVNGETATKSITVRVIDDAAVEPQENIIITYSITGSGLTAAPGTSHTINITDDDVLQNISTSPVTLFSQNFGSTTGSNQVPSGWLIQNAGTSTINKWVVNNNGAAANGFTDNMLHISDGTNGEINNGTAAYHYTASVAGTSVDARAFTPIFNANGFKNITVSFKIVCNGELFSGNYYDYGIVYYTLNGSNYSALTNGAIYQLQGITTNTTLNLTLPAGTVGTSTFGLLFRWFNDEDTDVQPPFAIDDIVVTGQGAGVETVATQASSNIQTSGQSAQYLSPTGNIITNIVNLNQNVGCITATVTNAGNGLIPLTTTGGSYSRSEKVIRITPSIANTTATYQATFYFTTAELAAWGSNVPNLKIMKVTDGTNLASILNNSNSTIYTPVVNDLRSTAGYASFTINATGGFSQFLLVSQNVTVPVNLLSFEATPNGKNILLNWSTSTEINNRGFVVERSSNGTNFDKIGWVDGSINSNRESRYSFADNFVQPGQLYYYRLRQTDIDARETLSEIRSAKIKAAANLFITLSPNPAKGQLNVFTSGVHTLSDINIYDAKGQLLRSWRKVNCAVAPYRLNISNLAAGIYLIQVNSGNETKTEKLMIHP